MTMGRTYSVSRVPVLPEPWVQAGYRYADSFELRLVEPDDHSAEEWMRTAVDHAAPWVLAVIRFVHARFLRFSLSTEANSVLGWDTVSSAADAFHIETKGPAFRAEIVLRRRSGTTASVTTFLFHDRRTTALLWLVVGPLHRRIAPYLMARAAEQLTTRTPRPADERQTGAPGEPRSYFTS